MEVKQYLALLIVVNYLGFIASMKVFLHGPSHVMHNSELWINCTGDPVPYGNAAEFLLNGVTYATMNKFDGKCFSTLHNQCKADQCQCSEDGKTFYIKIQQPFENKDIHILCAMKFKSGALLSVTSEIIITVLAVPTLYIKNEIACKKEDAINISCTLQGDATEYGFNDWNYTRQHVIKHDVVHDNMNRRISLSIINCSFENEGQYICNAWYSQKSSRVRLTASTTLQIQASPLIVSSTILKDTVEARYIVQLISNPGPLAVKWYQNHKLLSNSTSVFLTVSKRLIPFNDQLISGWECILHKQYVGRPQHEITIHVSNIYGTASHTFNIDNEKSTNNVRSFLFVITISACVVIINFGVVGVIIFIKNGIYSIRGNRSPIYLAAPQNDNSRQVYTGVVSSNDELVSETSNYEEFQENIEYEEIQENSMAASNQETFDYEEAHSYREHKNT